MTGDWTYAVMIREVAVVECVSMEVSRWKLPHATNGCIAMITAFESDTRRIASVSRLKVYVEGILVELLDDGIMLSSTLGIT